MVGGKEVSATGKHAVLAKRDDAWRMLVCEGLRRKNGNFEEARRWAQAQYRNFYGDFARRDIRNTVPLEPAPELLKLVQHNIIKWAKSRPKA